HVEQSPRIRGRVAPVPLRSPTAWAVSSAWSERLPYKQEVPGSSPGPPIRRHARQPVQRGRFDVRAAVYDRYGSPDVLRIEDVPTPSPGRGQVLVRVEATSINLSDWECLRGSPLYARLGGWRAPARRTLGSDVAGWVEAVGEGVTRFA